MTQDVTGDHGNARDIRPDSPDAIFAARLRTLRLAARMTQAEVAEHVGMLGGKMHRSAIAKIESGDRTVSVGEATWLARVLGVPLDALLSEPGEHESEQAALNAARAKVSALAYEAIARGQALREAEMLYEDAHARLQEAQRELAKLDPNAWRGQPDRNAWLAKRARSEDDQ